MKGYFLLTFILFTAIMAAAQSSNPAYDADLAGKLGADEYGMKSYVLVMLKTGANTTTDKAYVDSCFAGHMTNMERLTGEGKLIVAGPMGKNNRSYRGIFILDMPFDDAPALLKTDPAISSGLLDFEIFRWYGSAALPLYLEASDKIWMKQP